MYCFVDPFGRIDSGVTSYISIARNVLGVHGLESCLVQRRGGESLEAFRDRIAIEIGSRKDIRMIEAPESLAATLKLRSPIPIHVRLHCAKTLGAYLQGEKPDEALRLAEQEVILAAHVVSAPSARALAATRLLFELPRDCVVIENPFPSYSPRRAGERVDFDVLFVGRPHFLKGFGTFIDTARANPKWRFVAVLPEGSVSEWKIPKNVRLVQGVQAWKAAIYHRAKVLFVPSLFETASVVAAEGVAMGIPVVVTNEVGIVEYASPPAVRSVTSRNTDEISAVLGEAMLGVEPFCTADIIGKNNLVYFESIKELSVRNTVVGKKIPLDNSDFDFIKELPRVATELRKGNGELTPFQRKFRKLRRSPAKFFRDSKEFGFMFRIFDSIRNSKPGIAPIQGVPIVDAAEAPDVKTLQITAVSQAVQNVVEQKIARELTVPLSLESIKRDAEPALFVDIKETGKIVFSIPPEKPPGFISAIIFSRDLRSDFSKSLVQNLNGFSDFLPLSKEKLQVGFFSTGFDQDSVDYINRIDLENKKRLGKISHLFLVDAPASLCQALRSCSTDIRLNLIVTNRAMLADASAEFVDSVTVVDENQSIDRIDLSKFRKAFTLSNAEILPKTIRKMVQEAAPKRPDMLVPIFGFDDFSRDEFLNFDFKNFQGIVRVDSSFVPPLQASARASYTAIAPHILGLAVLDSVYLQYKGQLDRGIEHDSLAKFLEFSLCDGNIFRIENV